jgi:hypothetical protein
VAPTLDWSTSQSAHKRVEKDHHRRVSPQTFALLLAIVNAEHRESGHTDLLGAEVGLEGKNNLEFPISHFLQNVSAWALLHEH